MRSRVGLPRPEAPDELCRLQVEIVGREARQREAGAETPDPLGPRRL